MKKIILSIAVLSATFAFAQEKEIKAANDAVSKKDIATAKTQIEAADAKLNGKLYLLEPEIQEQYLFSKGFILLQSGKSAEAAEMIGKISELGQNKIYTGKNSNKERVYYIGKDDADASGVAGLKEETYQPKTMETIKEFVGPLLQKSNQEAVDAYNSKNYNVAGPKFKEVYNFMKSIGQENKQYLYNAALSYGLANDYSEANRLFTQLLNGGYNGVETTYTAKDKDGKVEPYSKAVWEQLKKNPAYSEFKTEKSKSIESDLYDAAVKIQIEGKLYDDALVTIDKGLQKFPKNSYLATQKGVVLFKTGKTSEFIASLKQTLAQNPNDASNWFNLGVMQSNDATMLDDAKKSYAKAIEIDPKMKDAYRNLTYLEIGDDAKTIEEYGKMKKSGNMEEANKILKARRERFINAIPNAEKWYQADPTNVEIV